ncbi:MAG: hypothetical protein ACTS5I_04725, partial [Rhodanobacter sp.]
MHPGTQQDQRLAAALHPGYVVPDEFTLAERIRLILEHAALLKFSTSDGTDGGHWDDALRGDESVLLADMASYPLEAAQQGFAMAWPWAGEAHLWRRVRQLLHCFDRWCQWLERHDTPAAMQVRQAMALSMAAGLRELLHNAVRCFGLDAGEAKTLHRMWHIGALVTDALPQPLRLEQRLQVLRRLWGALGMVIAELRSLAQSQLPHSLSSTTHEPAMGLLLTVLQLYQDTRAPLNRFPEQFTDFYYLKLLGMRPRKRAIEQVHLCLKRDPNYRASVQIHRDTHFIGGNDRQGRAIEFVADHFLEVTDNEVVALYNLRLERDPLISPEKELGYTTRLKTQAITPHAPGAASSETPAWWPLFGGQSEERRGKAQNAVLGLAVASPVLALREADRRIKLVLRLSHPATADEALWVLLGYQAELRSEAWLCGVFARFGDYEARHHPSLLSPMYDESDQAMAQAAWRRTARSEGDVYLCYLLARCLAADAETLFRDRLGRLFAEWLTAANEALNETDVVALRQHAGTLLGSDRSRSVEIDDPLILIYPHTHTLGHGLPDRG